jgi:arginine decarboxylase
MGPIRVVWGAAAGPTAMGSYDAALAAAGVENYNLVPVSSVIPAGADVEIAETVPDLGPAGDRVTVVEGRETVWPDEADRACAALGWARAEDGRGLFYEGAGTDPERVRGHVEDGLAAGRDLRDWTFTGGDLRLVTAPADPDSYTTAVVLAVYGSGDSIL